MSIVIGELSDAIEAFIDPTKRQAYFIKKSLIIAGGSIATIYINDLRKKYEAIFTALHILDLYYYYCGNQADISSSLKIDAETSNCGDAWLVCISEQSSTKLGFHFDRELVIDTLSGILSGVNKSSRSVASHIFSTSSSEPGLAAVTTPEITLISPNTFQGSSSSRQTLTIKGSGFLSDSTLTFHDGITFFANRVPKHISPNELQYDVFVGPETADWTVKVVNGGVESDPFPFHVVAPAAEPDNSAPGAPTGLQASPEGWSKTGFFYLDWTNPSDPSGIAKVWWKLGSPPTSANDALALSFDLPLFKPMPVSVVTDGETPVYIWLEDAAGNKDHNNRASVTLHRDTAAPRIAITGPTSGDTLTGDSGSVVLSGTAADDLSGLESIIWINGQGDSGTITTGSSWTSPAIGLSEGDNVILVIAQDAAGNASSDSITVTYGISPGSSGPVDSVATDTGSILVDVVPYDARASGAQWRIAGKTDWRNSGEKLEAFTLGTHRIEFKPVAGWHTPPDREITITKANPDIWVDSAPYLKDTAPEITYLSLGNGNPFFRPGQSYNIIVSGKDDAGVVSLDFHYSGDNGKTWNLIEPGFTPSVQFEYGQSRAWQLPTGLPVGNSLKIKLVAWDGLQQSTELVAGPYEVRDGTAPAITITSPNGGEVWDMGTEREITWSLFAPNGVANLKLYSHLSDTIGLVANIPEHGYPVASG